MPNFFRRRFQAKPMKGAGYPKKEFLLKRRVQQVKF